MHSVGQPPCLYLSRLLVMSAVLFLQLRLQAQYRALERRSEAQAGHFEDLDRRSEVPDRRSEFPDRRSEVLDGGKTSQERSQRRPGSVRESPGAPRRRAGGALGGQLRDPESSCCSCWEPN